MMNGFGDMVTIFVVLLQTLTGMVYDGAEGSEDIVSGTLRPDGVFEIDHQLDASTVTVQFTGFESSLHGIMKFEMAVGTEPEKQDVLPFTEDNVVHVEETNVEGNGMWQKSFKSLAVPRVNKHNLYTLKRNKAS